MAVELGVLLLVVCITIPISPWLCGAALYSLGVKRSLLGSFGIGSGNNEPVASLGDVVINMVCGTFVGSVAVAVILIPILLLLAIAQ